LQGCLMLAYCRGVWCWLIAGVSDVGLLQGCLMLAYCRGVWCCNCRTWPQCRLVVPRRHGMSLGLWKVGLYHKICRRQCRQWMQSSCAWCQYWPSAAGPSSRYVFTVHDYSVRFSRLNWSVICVRGKFHFYPLYVNQCRTLCDSLEGVLITYRFLVYH